VKFSVLQFARLKSLPPESYSLTTSANTPSLRGAWECKPSNFEIAGNSSVNFATET
jgi:hypothetical protein